MIKLVVEVWKKPEMSFHEFTRRWRDRHGALVKHHASAMGFVRYVQSHKQLSEAIETFTKERGFQSPPDGLSELWWESIDEMQRALASHKGQVASAELEADERQFCDTRKLSAFLAVEETIFDHTGPTRQTELTQYGSAVSPD